MCQVITFYLPKWTFNYKEYFSPLNYLEIMLCTVKLLSLTYLSNRQRDLGIWKDTWPRALLQLWFSIQILFSGVHFGLMNSVQLELLGGRATTDICSSLSPSKSLHRRAGCFHHQAVLQHRQEALGANGIWPGSTEGYVLFFFMASVLPLIIQH